MVDIATLAQEAKNLAAADRNSAIERFRVGADLGNNSAKFQLAIVLADFDPASAKKILAELDDENFDGAAATLARLFWSSDRHQAEHWYRRAIARNDSASVGAALGLGSLLYKTHPDEAIPLLEMALDAGAVGAAFWLAVAIEDSNASRAKYLYELSLDQGELQAHYRLGRLLEMEGQIDSARRHFERGASLGEVAAMVGLAHAYPWTHPILKAKWMYRGLRGGALKRNFETHLRDVS